MNRFDNNVLDKSYSSLVIAFSFFKIFFLFIVLFNFCNLIAINISNIRIANIMVKIIVLKKCVFFQ